MKLGHAQYRQLILELEDNFSKYCIQLKTITFLALWFGLVNGFIAGPSPSWGPPPPLKSGALTLYS